MHIKHRHEKMFCKEPYALDIPTDPFTILELQIPSHETT